MLMTRMPADLSIVYRVQLHTVLMPVSCGEKRIFSS
jgi:hypothetical protein